MMPKLLILCCLLSFITTLTPAKIVFRSNRDGNGEIYVMNDDGSNVQRLTKNAFTDYTPRWSPDGKQIAFVRNTDKRDFETDLFIMSANGSNQRQLINRPGPDGPDITWAPDGKRIAFVSTRNGNIEIYVLDITSGKVKQLIDNHSFSVEPDWSPDGKQIAYRNTDADRGITIYTMSTDGTNQKPLLPPQKDRVLRFSPTWAPDSRRVAFCEMEWKEIRREVELIAVKVIIIDTISEHQQIKEFPIKWGLQDICWMADGELLVAAADKIDGYPDIYRYHLSTDEMTNLTNNPTSSDHSMHWVPDTLDVSPAGKLRVQWGKIKGEKSPVP